MTSNLLRDFLSHLTLRVADEDIIVCRNGDEHHFFLCAEGLTAAGNTQPERIGVQEVLLVTDYHVAGNGIDAVVNAAPVRYFLHTEGNEHGDTLGDKGALGINFADA